MKKYKNVVFASILITSLIIPTTSFASTNNQPVENKSVKTIFNQVFSFFQGKNDSVVMAAEINVSYDANEYSAKSETFYIGDEKFNSYVFGKYSNHHRDHDKHWHRHNDDCYNDPIDPVESKDIWKDWYGKWPWSWTWPWQ